MNALLIVTSLFGYLEWGGGNSSFLLEAEFTVLKKLFTNPTSVVHPLVLCPLLGQVLLLITLFKKAPHRTLTYSGIACTGALLAFIFFIALIRLDFKILLSTLPFMTIAIATIWYHRSG